MVVLEEETLFKTVAVAAVERLSFMSMLKALSEAERYKPRVEMVEMVKVRTAVEAALELAVV